MRHTEPMQNSSNPNVRVRGSGKQSMRHCILHISILYYAILECTNKPRFHADVNFFSSCNVSQIHEAMMCLVLNLIIIIKRGKRINGYISMLYTCTP